ncbi:hypothetical protein [Serratia fonticola]|uniref:hypothetical protein n=1 Tax=Serratia fonticola TaxID=47917 RepID=UPI0021BB0793|nr:hypothetical protein [Serratia fonticola]
MIKRFFSLCIYAAAISIIFIMLGMWLLTGIGYWRDTHFSCDTMLIVKKKDDAVSLAMTYFLNGDNGFVVIKGKLDKEKSQYNVSRKTYFIVRKTGELLHVKSILTVKTPADNALMPDLKDILPVFYLEKDIKMEITVEPQGWNGYLFSTGYVPSFYCRRT